MAQVQKITPFLWLDGCAREAAHFYVSVFRSSRIVSDITFTQGPARGSAMVAFELDGMAFTAFDGIPAFQFSPAISFVVGCDTQDEIDDLWERLGEDGAPGQCGWLEDKFGVFWQIIPAILPELMQPEPKAAAVLQALLTMHKPDLRQLQDAYARG